MGILAINCIRNRISPAILAFAMCALLTGGAKPAKVIDSPVKVRSLRELDALSRDFRFNPEMSADWDAFNEAVSYISAYVSAEYDRNASDKQKDELLRSLVSGRSPRQIIVLGHVLLLLHHPGPRLDSGKLNGSENETSDHLENNLRQATEAAARKTLQKYISADPKDGP